MNIIQHFCRLNVTYYTYYVRYFPVDAVNFGRENQSIRHPVGALNQHKAHAVGLDGHKQVGQARSVKVILGVADAFVPIFADDFDLVRLGIFFDRVALAWESISLDLSFPGESQRAGSGRTRGPNSPNPKRQEVPQKRLH